MQADSLGERAEHEVTRVIHEDNGDKGAVEWNGDEQVPREPPGCLVCMCIYVCMGVCVCVREGERTESERERVRKIWREIEIYIALSCLGRTIHA